jgi:hypothetical protein
MPKTQKAKTQRAASKKDLRARRRRRWRMPSLAQDKASELREQGSARLQDQFDKRSSKAGSQARALAAALRRSAADLSNEDNGNASQLTTQAADRIERVGSYLEQKSGERADARHRDICPAPLVYGLQQDHRPDRRPHRAEEQGRVERAEQLRGSLSRLQHGSSQSRIGGFLTLDRLIRKSELRVTLARTSENGPSIGCPSLFFFAETHSRERPR